MIYFDFKDKRAKSYATLVRKVLDACLVCEGVEFKPEISVVFVDKGDMQAINGEFRGVDKPTDCLSFPQVDFDVFNASANTAVMLGDIVICLDVALEQADEYGHSIEREVAFLVAHSFLHLMGYDHEDKDDEATMISKQEHILASAGILRG